MTERRASLAVTGCLLNSAVFAISALIALLVAEGLVRLAAPQQLILVRPDMWMPADSVGWLNRPAVRTMVNTGERTVHFYTDSAGFRVGAVGRVDASHRVLIIGDSFMEALQMEYEQSLAGLLQSRLPADLGYPIAIRNAGIDGWDPPQFSLRARTLLNREHYDLVLVALYLGRNDYPTHPPTYFPPRTHVAYHAFHFPRGVSHRELVDAVFFPIDDFLKTRSQLFILLKTRFQILLMRLGLSAEHFPPDFYRQAASPQEWSLTADLCAAIAREATAHNSRALFVLVPAPFQVDVTQFRDYIRGLRIDSAAVDIDQPNKILGAELRDRHLGFVDPLPGLRAAGASAGPLYGHVDRHLTPAGQALLEQLVEPSVLVTLKGM
jgi:hypothetical protein